MIAALLVAAPATGIVYDIPTDETMVLRSPVIVYGVVVSAAPGPAGDLPVTEAVVRVEELLKGPATRPATIVVRQLGGVGEGGLVTTVMGQPMLAPGDRVLLFLDEDGDVHRTVELALGIFFEVSSRERTLLLRGPSVQSESASPPGAPPAAVPGRPVRDSARFRRWIADRADGRGPRADYYVADRPEGPPSVASPYVVATGPCAGELLPLRWDEFDRGGSVAFTVHGSQRGVPGGGLTEVQAAIRAWSKVAGASVSLSASASTEAYDYRMSIGFDDPDDWLFGSYDPSTGGALAATVVGFDCDVSAHAIPGSATRAYALTRAYIITQDGFHLWLEGGKAEDAGANLAEVMAHELGHAIGLAHACGVNADGRSEGVCDAVTADAIMRASVGGAGRGARLGVDDKNAIKYLYPASSSGGGDPPTPDPEPPPLPVPPTASFSVDVECGGGLCRALTGQDVTFTDTSAGTVARRSWDFYLPAGSAPSAETVRHAWDEPGFYEVTLTVSGAEKESRTSRMFLVEAAEPEGTCAFDAETSCLQDSRYTVTVEWWTADGQRGAAPLIHEGTNNSGMFHFFDRGNWEVLVKVLDGRHVNDHVWVFAASTTDLGFVIRVTDTATGMAKEYRNEPGMAAAAITDSTAFPAPVD